MDLGLFSDPKLVFHGKWMKVDWTEVAWWKFMLQEKSGTPRISPAWCSNDKKRGKASPNSQRSPKLMCHCWWTLSMGVDQAPFLDPQSMTFEIWWFSMVFPSFSGWGFECMRVFIFSWKCLLSPWVQRVEIHDFSIAKRRGHVDPIIFTPKITMYGWYKVVNHPPMVGFLLALPH